MIQSKTKSILEKTIDDILNQLPSHVSPEKMNDFLSYQPLEESFFLQKINNNDTVAATSNPHFQYNPPALPSSSTSSSSTSPAVGLNFLQRELQIMEERKLKEQHILAKRLPQHQSAASASSSLTATMTGPQHRSTTLSSGLRSLIQAEPKKSAKTISDAKVCLLFSLSFIFLSLAPFEQIREIEKKRKLGEDEPKSMCPSFLSFPILTHVSSASCLVSEQEKIQRTAEFKNAILSTSSNQTTGFIATPPSSLQQQQSRTKSLPPFSSPGQPTHSPAPAPAPSSQPLLSTETMAPHSHINPSPFLPPPLTSTPTPPFLPTPSDSIVPGLSHSAPTLQRSDIPEILQSSQYGSLISAFFDEGVLLSPNDKQQIINFYIDRCESLSLPFLSPLLTPSHGSSVSHPETAPLIDSANPPIEQKFKLYEKDTVPLLFSSPLHLSAYEILTRLASPSDQQRWTGPPCDLLPHSLLQRPMEEDNEVKEMSQLYLLEEISSLGSPITSHPLSLTVNLLVIIRKC
jgi:hypothetical protein